MTTMGGRSSSSFPRLSSFSPRPYLRPPIGTERAHKQPRLCLRPTNPGDTSEGRDDAGRSRAVRENVDQLTAIGGGSRSPDRGAPDGERVSPLGGATYRTDGSGFRPGRRCQFDEAAKDPAFGAHEGAASASPILGGLPPCFESPGFGFRTPGPRIVWASCCRHGAQCRRRGCTLRCRSSPSPMAGRVDGNRRALGEPIVHSYGGDVILGQVSAGRSRYSSSAR